MPRMCATVPDFPLVSWILILHFALCFLLLPYVRLCCWLCRFVFLFCCFFFLLSCLRCSLSLSLFRGFLLCFFVSLFLVLSLFFPFAVGYIRPFVFCVLCASPFMKLAAFFCLPFRYFPFVSCSSFVRPSFFSFVY